jgi:DNA transformation protein
MKIKTDKNAFAEWVCEQLSGMSGIASKSMFGGHGIYSDGIFFAVIFSGRVYFKTDEITRERYLQQGRGPFSINDEVVLKNYYEVPVDVLEDPDELTIWAREAVQLPVKPKKRRRP